MGRFRRSFRETLLDLAIIELSMIAAAMDRFVFSPANIVARTDQ
jgi:hypothetical protein